MPGNPRGKGRPRFYRGHAVTPKATREYERDFASLWKGGEPTSDPVRVIIKAYYPCDYKANKARKRLMLDNAIRPTKKPDIDNVTKIVLDALNGVAFVDDAQVIEVLASKYFSSEPRVEIRVQEFTEEELIKMREEVIKMGIDMHKAGYSAGYYATRMGLDTVRLARMKSDLFDAYDNDPDYIEGFEQSCIQYRRQIANNGSRFHIKETENERN